MDNLGLLSGLHFPNVLLPCSPLMYSALMVASLYGCRCFMCKKNGLKRSLTNCETSSGDFNLSKCRRLDHEGNSLAPLSDVNGSHKCAGTQTLFSSFVPVPGFYSQPHPPPDSSHDMTNEEEPRFILDLDRHMARSSQVHPGVVLGGMRRPSPPPRETESSNAPLNLTLSPSLKSSLRSQPVGRDANRGGWPAPKDQPYILPSDRATSRLPAWSSEGRDHSRPGSKAPEPDKTNRPQAQHKIWALTHDPGALAKNKPQSASPRKVTSVVTVECQKDIEEHFQRSLGKDYPKCLAKSSSNSSVGGGTESLPPPAPEQSTNAPARRNGAVQTTPTTDVALENCKGNGTISGAVDDHFAKSLGQTWTKLKSQNSQTDLKSPQPGSVDDHFAKALGEAWFKLRVKKEGT